MLSTYSNPTSPGKLPSRSFGLGANGRVIDISPSSPFGVGVPQRPSLSSFSALTAITDLPT